MQNECIKDAELKPRIVDYIKQILDNKVKLKRYVQKLLWLYGITGCGAMLIIYLIENCTDEFCIYETMRKEIKNFFDNGDATLDDAVYFAVKDSKKDLGL